MEKIDENPTISDEASFGLGSSGITPVLDYGPCFSPAQRNNSKVREQLVPPTGE
jgi:hypothetical protein